MRRITEPTKFILRKLFQPKDRFDIFGSSKKREIRELLLEIKESGEPAVIPEILYLIFSKEKTISQTAAMTIDHLLKCLSAKDLIWFDQYFRQQTTRWAHYSSDWNNLKAAKINFFSKFPGFQLSLLGLLSIHSNGHIREEALKRLNLIEDGREIPFILLRLNDWVDQVKAEASKAMEKRITQKNAKYFLSNIYLISALARYHRHDHSSFIGSIHTLIRNRELQDTVRQALLCNDLHTRRECYKIALKSDKSFLTEVVKQGIEDSDVIIRNCVIKSLRSISDHDLLKKYLEILESDPFMPNRREVLNLYIELFPEISKKKLLNALFDQHPSIRYDARYYLSKLSKHDFGGIYREAVKNPDGRNINGIISGLGETGEANDASLITMYTKNRAAKTRKVSIKAIAKLSPENYRTLFLSLIKDDSPRVSREAMSALLRCRYQVIIPELWESVGRSDKIHIARNILFIISKFSKWESISYFIAALTMPSDNLREIANDYLNRWLTNFNRSFTKPTSDQRKKIEHLINLHSKEIGDKRLKAIMFNLKTI
jgi:hypothetical protein